MKNEEILKLIDYYIERREFSKSNSYLRKIIISIYTNKIRKYKEDYYYSTPVELLEEVEKYLPYEDIINFNKFYYALNENLMEHEETNALLKIFKSIISSKWKHKYYM